MFCFQDQKNNRYLCSSEIKRMDPSFIKLTTTDFINTHIPPPTYSSNRVYIPQMTDAEIAFAFFSTYLLFPLLYIIISTGNIRPVMILWQFIQSGIFNTVQSIKEFLTDVVYTTLRIFGQYTFSTYTVVKNGREIYSASSMCFYKKSDVNSVYRIDRAKYNVCKWIDRQCKQYKIDNSGEEPELTETHNDIYDFIVHKVEGQPYVRIHRGDFTGRTHTLIDQHYRPFKKWKQIANYAELTVCLPPKGDTDTNTDTNTNTEGNNTESTNTSETFRISLKYPHDYFLEKNELLDKKFLQWKMYYEHGRADVSNYIGQPFSKYTLTLPYHECMKQYMKIVDSKALNALNEAEAEKLEKMKEGNETRTDSVSDTPTDNEPFTVSEKDSQSIIYHLNDSHSILIGSKFIVKVDSILRCPVFESNDSQVYDIDCMLTSYYSCSDSDTESESDSDSEVDIDNIENEYDNNTDDESDINTKDVSTNDNIDDPEFEMIEEPVQ